MKYTSARWITFVALGVAVGLLNAPATVAQSAAAAPSKFEVASIKPNTGGGRGSYIRPSPGGRFNAENIRPNLLIQIAYNVGDFQILGAPAWIGSDSYDITAKAETDATFEQMRSMLQSLLADRFKLMLHRETKELPVYDLAPAKSGLKLVASKEGSCTTPSPGSPLPRPGEKLMRFCGAMRMGRGVIDAVGVSMLQLQTSLSVILGRTVVDKTGFTGTFDVHLEYTPDRAIVDPVVGAQAGPAPPTDSAGPSIFTALQEQLGLRLESSKGPVEVLVIDHMERPSDN